MPGSQRREMLDPGKPLTRWFVGHQGADLILAVVACGLVWLLCHDVALPELDASGRRAAYQTIAGLCATLLGLTMTTVSVLASNIDKPIGGSSKGIPQGLVIGISMRMFGLIRALGLSVAISLLLLLVDTSAAHGAVWPQPVLGALTVVVALRLTRVLILLANLLPARVGG